MNAYTMFSRHCICSLAFFAVSTCPTHAQEEPPRTPQEQSKPAPVPRGQRIGAFLGLGAEPDAAAAARGEKLYSSNCAFCHGVKATGAEGPDLVRSTLVLHDDNGDSIGQLLQKGRPDKGMPAFPSLSPAQVSDIAAFLHMRVYLAANRGTYKVENVVTGDAKAGEAYFGGAGHCNTCHSATGDLAHIAAKYQPAELQAAFLYPASVARFESSSAKEHQRDQVKVTLPSGQSYGGSLKRLDDFVVSLYDASGTYHSWMRQDGIKVEVNDPLAVHRQLLDQYTDADMHNILAYLETLK